MIQTIAVDWIEKFGGAEKVLDRMVACFPDAQILTLWNDDVRRYPDLCVVESWMSKTPLRRRKPIAAPLMAATWRRLPVADGDRVLISSHSYAHHFASHSANVERFAYIHSPARWIWARELDARGNGALMNAALPLLQRQDRAGVTPRTRYASNSHFVADRVKKSWGVDSQVIYPPVDTARLQAVSQWCDELGDADRKIYDSLPGDFLIGASRFVRYKRLDLAISFAEEVGLPIVIAGSGPLEQRLRERAARATVPAFVIHAPSDELLRSLIQRARAYIYPPVEDFGIMPVEAYALGTPVMVNHTGGAVEAATSTGGGVPVDFTSPGAWRSNLQDALGLSDEFRLAVVEQFSNYAFEARLREWID